ncbi:hypothetical protein EV644_11937 [Kribbella orskensis]|uniref:AAA+ ATPase domain-containing protein n=1 Tax=Kribbella orskensis TaxID=2512216 RepID=A0ABY2BBC9_9ACTN|nr:MULTISPECIES: dynamin family protein [Kribbella]TCN34645.1 hypothetical protein EV642_120106 [Kribbella sp. VKM Ac-2500]TCO14924.1 hypothetical protein EV644_11937 [Kribbella orskensis]
MADTRSAAGEGSERSGEPKVPAQDQPAQDLPRLITETDAKGKGFWRRRKRKAASTADAPVAVSTTDAAAAVSTTVAAAGTADAPEGGSVEPSAEVAPADAVKAVVDDKPADAQDKKVESGDDVAEVKDAADAESDVEAEGAEADAKVVDAAEEGAGKKDEAAEDVAADETAVGEPEASEADGSEVVAEKKVGEPRPTVGVVYEPDESPDGFPMEYGEIIIGLPKQSASKKKSAKSAEESSDRVAVDDPAIEVAADGASAEGAIDEPAAEKTETAAETTDADEGGPEPEVEQAGAAGDAADEAVPADEAQADEAQADEVVAEQVAGKEAADDAAAEQAADGAPADQAAEDALAAEGPDDAPADDAPEPQVEQAADGVPAEDALAEDTSAERAADDASAEQADEGDPVGGAADEPAGEQADAVDDGPEAAVVQAEAGADAAGEAVPTDEAPAEEADGELAAEGSGDASDEGAAEGAPADDVQAPEDPAAENPGDQEPAAENPGDQEPAAENPGDQEPAAEGEGAVAGESAVDGDSTSGDEAAADEEPGNGESDGDAEQAAAAGAGKAQGQAAKELVEAPAEKSVEEVAAEQAAMALITALMRLRGALASSRLPLDVVEADEARQQQKAMLDQLDDYILPRLVQLEAPVLAVVGGSTGAGKSTLVNSLIGQVVSEPGVLRPTTRSPVLIHNPADAEWFAGDRVLPGMARSSGDSPGGMEDPGQIRLVASDTVPQGLAILDAPDIDSVVEANRDLATQLLAAADLWLFVTTAARYADAVPWDFLQSASDRSTAVAVVLDRAPGDTIDDITGHLAQMLLERGLGDSPLFSIKETVVDGNGMLPSELVASIKDWLIDLAADAEARSAVVRRTLHGAVTAMTKQTPAFAKAVRAQADTAADLRQTAETAYERAVKDIAKATQDGTMLRGEVLARWQEFVGTGELLKGLQTNVGRMRDKVRTSVVGKPPPTRNLNDAVESGLESLLREHAEAAAERAEESWQSTASGRQLLAAGDRDMGRMSKEFPAEAGRAVREWQGYVLDLVRKEGADKRSTARILAYGVNGLGLSLMVVIFASAAEIPTGAEVGAGLGTAVVGQKLLEAVFGDQAVRTLAAKARDDLDGKVHALMDAEFARYLAVLDQHPVDPDTPRRLTEAARAVEDCT